VSGSNGTSVLPSINNGGKVGQACFAPGAEGRPTFMPRLGKEAVTKDECVVRQSVVFKHVGKKLQLH